MLSTKIVTQRKHTYIWFSRVFLSHSLQLFSSRSLLAKSAHDVAHFCLGKLAFVLICGQLVEDLLLKNFDFCISGKQKVVPVRERLLL